ncbi:methylglyoxal synthase [Sporosarcina koreensis]|uniref:Methylglyoxal synthase n=1 Tax=Sporosarcina koreensis TaxID=334735 RepID=A0ABW0TV86_9BACL
MEVLSLNIALIAHDQKKDEMVNFTIAYKHVFEKYELYATGTTGKRIMNETGLHVHRMMSGPLGGDQQIGAMVATGKLDLILFFRDPLTAQPHEPDVSALLRLCDVYGIPLATNIATAELLLAAVEKGYFTWRDTADKYKTKGLDPEED